MDYLLPFACVLLFLVAVVFWENTFRIAGWLLMILALIPLAACWLLVVLGISLLEAVVSITRFLSGRA